MREELDIVHTDNWVAWFQVVIGEEGIKCNIVADVTCNQELDPDSIYVTMEYTFTIPDHAGYLVAHSRTIEVNDLINDGHRQQIEDYFDRHYGQIYYDAHAE